MTRRVPQCDMSCMALIVSCMALIVQNQVAIIFCWTAACPRRNKVMDEETVADLLNKITTENNTSDDPAELAREQLIAS